MSCRMQNFLAWARGARASKQILPGTTGLLRRSLLFTVLILSTAAESANAERDELAVSAGGTLHFELVGDAAGRNVPAVPVNDPSSAQSVIRVVFAIDGMGNRTLRIKSTYTRSIAFDFRLCEGAPVSDCKTVVENFVIAGGEEMSQLLQDQVHRILFFNFIRVRDVDASNGLIANSMSAGIPPCAAAELIRAPG